MMTRKPVKKTRPKSKPKLSRPAYRALVEIWESLGREGFEKHLSRSLRSAFEDIDRRVSEQAKSAGGYVQTEELGGLARRRRRPSLEPKAFSALHILRREVGRKAFEAHTTPALRRSMEEMGRAIPRLAELLAQSQEHVSQQAVQAVQAFSDAIRCSPALRRWMREWEQARGGDLGSLRSLLEQNPFLAMRDEAVMERLQAISDGKVASKKNAIVSSFRRGFLSLSPGPPRRLPEVAVTAHLVHAVQELFESSPVRVKHSYNNISAWHLDAREMAEYIGQGFPDRFGPPIAHVAERLLLQRTPANKPKRWRDGFGKSVVAEFLGVTLQHLRAHLRPAVG